MYEEYSLLLYGIKSFRIIAGIIFLVLRSYFFVKIHKYTYLLLLIANHCFISLDIICIIWSTSLNTNDERCTTNLSLRGANLHNNLIHCSLHSFLCFLLKIKNIKPETSNNILAIQKTECYNDKAFFLAPIQNRR